VTDAIRLLQEWYAAQCNGDWEHSYGVRVDTLDNPGWILKVDLRGTEWEGLSLALDRRFVSDQDWMQFEIVDACYVACGDSSKLLPMIEAFIRLVWPARLRHSDASE